MKTATCRPSALLLAAWAIALCVPTAHAQLPDVVAATDDTRCLRISEEQLQDITQKDPALAARVAMGIAKALCLKLVRTSGLA